MSNKYKEGDHIPTAVLCARVDELVDAVIKGLPNEFTMRVPAELDRDADLVLSEVSRRLKDAERKLAEREDVVQRLVELARLTGTVDRDPGNPLQLLDDICASVIADNEREGMVQVHTRTLERWAEWDEQAMVDDIGAGAVGCEIRTLLASRQQEGE